MLTMFFDKNNQSIIKAPVIIAASSLRWGIGHEKTKGDEGTVPKATAVQISLARTHEAAIPSQVARKMPKAGFDGTDISQKILIQ